VAVHDPNQVMLFGAPPTPAEAFEALRGRGAVLRVYEGGKLDLQLIADLHEALW